MEKVQKKFIMKNLLKNFISVTLTIAIQQFRNFNTVDFFEIIVYTYKVNKKLKGD